MRSGAAGRGAIGWTEACKPSAEGSIRNLAEETLPARSIRIAAQVVTSHRGLQFFGLVPKPATPTFIDKASGAVYYGTSRPGPVSLFS
jgi:hypothetical protein